MPEEAYWGTLFDVPLILERLGIDARLRNVIEFGRGFQPSAAFRGARKLIVMLAGGFKLADEDRHHQAGRQS